MPQVIMSGNTSFDSNAHYTQTSPSVNGIALECIISIELNAIQSLGVQMQTLVLEYVTERNNMNKAKLLSEIMSKNTQLSNQINMIRSKKVQVETSQYVRISVSNN